jgi:hypothetical protein
MGFTPSTTKEALKRNGGDVTHTVDWLVSHGLVADELASPDHSRGKSATPKIIDQQPKTDSDGCQKGLSMPLQDLTSGSTDDEMILGVADRASTTQDITNNDPALPNSDAWPLATEARSPVKVQVVIPPKPIESAVEKPSSAPNRKAKRRKTTLDQPEAVTENNNMIPPMPEKKRGRGRPKKTVHVAASSDTIQQDKQEESPDPTLETIESRKADVGVPSAEPEAAVPRPQEAAAPIDVSTATPEPPLLPTRPEVSPITPERTTKSAKRDQSTRSTGKVPHRVGLSKRARVAPLLRTMRK